MLAERGSVKKWGGGRREELLWSVYPPEIIEKNRKLRIVIKM